MPVTYRAEPQGDWGLFDSAFGAEPLQEWLAMNDGTRLFCHVWRTNSRAMLLILHGLGAHSGWFLDMGTALDAADHPKKVTGLLLPPWDKDQSKVSVGTLLAVLPRGVFKSARSLAVAGVSKVMTTNPEAVKVLNADPYWVRAPGASFLWQITLMRGKVLRQARRVTLPALVLQAGLDRWVVAAASEATFRHLGSADKTWKWDATYARDSEFEADRSAAARWMMVLLTG
jgi:alpha-beta hydrolase superfamily lysophospholipase